MRSLVPDPAQGNRQENFYRSSLKEIGPVEDVAHDLLGESAMPVAVPFSGVLGWPFLQKGRAAVAVSDPVAITDRF